MGVEAPEVPRSKRRGPKGSGKANRKAMTPYRVALRQKEVEAIEMRIAGVPLREIAERLGWRSGASAHKAIKRALEERAKEGASHLRQLQLERLDRLRLALWNDAISGNRLAVDRVLKIMEREDLLMGLEAPQRRIVEVVTPEAFDEVLKAKEDRIAELRAELDGRGGDFIDATAEEVRLLEEGVDAEVVEAAVVVDNRGSAQD